MRKKIILEELLKDVDEYEFSRTFLVEKYHLKNKASLRTMLCNARRLSKKQLSLILNIKIDFWDKAIEYKFNYSSCVYFLFDRDGVVYIGQTGHLPQRINNHICSEKKFNRVFYLPVERKKLTRVENYFIRKFKPKYNLLREN